jgi:hypothetical protein
MSRAAYLRCIAGLGAATLLSLAAGCTSATTERPGHANLTSLAKYYGMYQGQNKGQTPPDEPKFKEFIAKRDSTAKLDELFVSPRDRQPYVVRYGLKVGVPDAKKGAPIIAYEKEGVGDKRMVARSTTQVDELDEAQFKELVGNP